MDRLRLWKTDVYCTDHWEAYAAAIPSEKHCITKRETTSIERNNGRQRHGLGRFRRRTVIVSKSLEMVNLTIALFAHYRINGNMDALLSLHG
jgi:IS1 family transposase